MRLAHQVGGLASQVRERLLGQRIHTWTRSLEESGVRERLGKDFDEMRNESVRDPREGFLGTCLIDEPEKLGARESTASSVVIDAQNARAARKSSCSRSNGMPPLQEQPGCPAQLRHFTELARGRWFVAASD